MSAPAHTVDLVVVMPLGPNDPPLDTLRSVLAYTTSSRLIIVVDDTGNPATAEELHALSPDIVVIKAGKYPGAWGGLWVKLTQGYRYALQHVRFKVLLRLDADALVIGSGAEQAAIAYFDKHPDVGLIGSYRHDCNHEARSFQHPAKTLAFEIRATGLLRPRVRATLSKALRAARAHQYEDGEHCLGGAYFQSFACIKALHDNQYLNKPELARSNLGEDQLFALFTKASGYHLDDFATGDHPLGLRWRGLPCSPADLIQRNKKIIHSVRFWQDMNEQDIRSFFEAKRDPQYRGHASSEYRGHRGRLEKRRLHSPMPGITEEIDAAR